jgi:hypothetical protein
MLESLVEVVSLLFIFALSLSSITAPLNLRTILVGLKPLTVAGQS